MRTRHKKTRNLIGTPLRKDELLVLTKLRIEKFISMLKIFDFLHSLLDRDNIPNYFKDKDDLQKSQTTLYGLVISYLFSLFDPKGTDIRNLTLIVKNIETTNLLSQISRDWQNMESQITRIRHNFGFHGGGFPQLGNAFNAFEEISQQGLTLPLATFMKKIELLDNALEQEM